MDNEFSPDRSTVGPPLIRDGLKDMQKIFELEADKAALISACDAVLDWADANARWFDISTAPWEEGVEFEICHAIEIERITVKIINGEAWEGCEPCDLAHFTHWRPVPPPPSNPPLPEPIEALGAVVRKIKGGE